MYVHACFPSGDCVNHPFYSITNKNDFVPFIYDRIKESRILLIPKNALYIMLLMQSKYSDKRGVIRANQNTKTIAG